MRKKIVAGNWKMNLTLDEGKDLAKDVVQQIKDRAFESEVAICPSFIHLEDVRRILKSSPGVKLGAQNCLGEENGAYTGEISAEMLASVDADCVILGHSERRNNFRESNAMLAKKVDSALYHGITPIFCVGESKEDRKKGKQNNKIQHQLKNGVFHLITKHLKRVIIAYEPVWAIGTGKNATPKQADEMHAYIRELIADHYDPFTAQDMTVIYGGSITAANAKDIFSMENVDGGLVGSASLNTNNFVQIVKALEAVPAAEAV